MITHASLRTLGKPARTLRVVARVAVILGTLGLSAFAGTRAGNVHERDRVASRSASVPDGPDAPRLAAR